MVEHCPWFAALTDGSRVNLSQAQDPVRFGTGFALPTAIRRPVPDQPP
jgi:hypothetical protein